MKRSPFFLIGLFLVSGMALFYFFGFHDTSGRPSFQHSTLVIERADGKQFPFSVEVALSTQEQAYGLMYVKSMPDNEGMIFPYPTPREVMFWMKDTFIPLDMLFVSSDGTIGAIVAEAKPFDVTPLSSQIPTIAVIEVNGGLAKRNGLAVGDKVMSPVLRPLPRSR